MKKQVEMICVSDMEGFDRDLYEKSKRSLTKYLQKFGWEFGDCVIEEGDKIWSCKVAAMWFVIPKFAEDNWDSC